MVENFNGEDYVPFMVLSVKAGGTGLNLTAANHVIHFDRWWNPAVEKVDIRISPLSEEKCAGIIEKCGRRIQNMESLINGEFPEDLQDLFVGGNGLFPSPKEISFQCSCPRIRFISLSCGSLMMRI